jgi:hypothetical protein
MRFLLLFLIRLFCVALTPNGSKRLKIGLGIGTDGADLLYVDSGLAAFMRADQLNHACRPIKSPIVNFTEL